MLRYCLGLGMTIFALRLSAHYNHLIKDTNKRSLQAIMDGLLVDVDLAKKDIEMLAKRCDTIVEDGRFHIQKVGLFGLIPSKILEEIKVLFLLL